MEETALVYGPACQAYNFGPEHPFTPVRGTMLTELLTQLGAYESVTIPKRAVRAEIRRLHSETYVAVVEAASSGQAPSDAVRFGLGTEDVPVFSGMHRATLWVVGGTLTAARLVANGTARRALHLAGGLHHAHRSEASGFCVYNDPAIAITELLQNGFSRIVYLDIDAHHGDGVQGLFYDDPRVLTISLHESGKHNFPGTGFPHETGRDAGTGYAANFPLEPNTDHNGYLEVFDKCIPQLLDSFKPEILVVECGADAHAFDPLARLQLTSHTFEELYHRILALAISHCNGRAVMHLGGGYDLDATTRAWAILALVMQDRDVPARLPQPWLDYWESELGRPLTATMHDTEYPRAADQRAQQQNLRAAMETMKNIAGIWL